MFKRVAAIAALSGALSLMVPAAPVFADGAASTRNIIIGGAAAALLIINHNRKVHEKYAEYDRQAAALSSQRDNAEAAYEQEQEAYNHEVAINSELKKEVAYQHSIIETQRKQLADLNVRQEFIGQAPVPSHGRRVTTRQVAVRDNPGAFSMGWGEL